MKRELVGFSVSDLEVNNPKVKYHNDIEYTCRDWKYHADGELEFNVCTAETEEEKAKFINFCGMYVNINNGDIALGLNPNPYQYISTRNIKEILSQVMFGKKLNEMEDGLFDEVVNLNWLLEMAKLSMTELNKQVYDEITENYRYSEVDNVECKSIILSMVKERIDEYDLPDEIKNLQDLTKNGAWLRDTCKGMIEMLKEVQRLAYSFYGYFVMEKSMNEVIDNLNSKKNLSDIYEYPISNRGNLETLYSIYRDRYKVPVIFLNALRTYGIGHKSRKIILDGYDRLNNCRLTNIASVAVKLSSMAYLSSQYVGVKCSKFDRTYNIIDLFNASGYENLLYFSMNKILEDKDSSLYSALKKKFDLKEVFETAGIDDMDFWIGLKDYIVNKSYIMDRSSLMSFDMNSQIEKQNSFPMFGNAQIENMGKIAENVLSKIKI